MQKSASLAERLERTPTRFLIVFSVIYAVGMAFCNARRAFWEDELFTVFLADLPSVKQILPLISRGIELNPPLPFWLTWVVHHTLGHGEIVTRLPASAGFWLMCLCLFEIVRRRADAAHGFIALLLPLFTYSSSEATWARGYGLMLGFSALAFLCWQMAGDGEKRPVATLGIAFAIAGAVSCHYYATYVVCALGIGELVRSWNAKQVDFGVCAGFAIGLTPLVAYASLIHRNTGHLKTFWVTPVYTFVYDAYADLLGPVMVAVLLLFARLQWVLPDRTAPQGKPRGLTQHETVVCAALCAMPLVLYLAGLVGPVACYPRYVQPVVIGYTILVVMFAYRFGGGCAPFRNAAVFVLIWLCFAPWAAWQGVKMLFFAPPGPRLMQLTDFDVAPDLPLVIDNDQDFFEMRHYAPQRVVDRLFMLDEPAAAVRFLGSDTALRSLEVAQSVSDQHLRPYREFLREHREFILVRTRSSSWIQQLLLADGADLKAIALNKPKGPFVSETLVYRVAVRL